VTRSQAIVSNGAFCLAPDKLAAFREAYRVLRPGGRVAVCLSVLTRAELEPGVHWPLCMRMFAPRDELPATVAAAGFERVHIDDSDSLMAFEIEEPDAAESAASSQSDAMRDPASGSTRTRNRVHVGSKEFEHLKNFDMNAICARVVVCAVKPDV
jgi:arsenite methyltransferase